MYKKYIFSILIFLLLFIPQTVFANSLHFETQEGDKYTVIDIEEDGDFSFRSKINAMSSSINSTLKKKEIKELVDIFEKDIIKDDELPYKGKVYLNTLTDSQNAYILSYCSDTECKTYFSDSHIMYTFDELENGEIGKFMENQMKGIFKIIIIIFAVVGVGTLLIPLVIVIGVIKMSSRGNTRKSIQVKEIENRINPTIDKKPKYKQTSKRKRDPWIDNDKDDPFSL